MFEVWGCKGEDNLVDVELDSIWRSEDDVSVVNVDKWVRRWCRSAVVHARARLHVIFSEKP